jgi:transcription elongation GreA/GreB family factor
VSNSPAPLSELDKRVILSAIDRQLAAEIEAAAVRAKNTAASATHEEARPEDDKDTRAIEESYLARGQAQRVADLEHERALLRSMDIAASPTGAAAVGSLVRLEDEDGERTVFLVTAGGGRRVVVKGLSILLVTPGAPLGAVLMGCREGDEFEITVKGRTRDVSVLDVA